MRSSKPDARALHLDYARYDRHPTLQGLSAARKTELLDALFQIVVQFIDRGTIPGSEGCG